jgi:RNA polymerase sigma factor (sigma-70 family)
MAQNPLELIPTRATLLERLKVLDDHVSWTEFADIYGKLITLTARKAGLDDAEAEDVLQETMIEVAQRMPAFRYDPTIGSFKAWLLNITRWRIIDRHRKRQNFARHVSQFGEIATLAESNTNTRMVEKVVDPQSLDLDAYWNAEWKKHMLSAATDRVRPQADPQKYQMFDLYVNKEWTAQKVAAAFKVPVEQVYLAKHRITEMLKEEIQRLEKDRV